MERNIKRVIFLPVNDVLCAKVIKLAFLDGPERFDGAYRSKGPATPTKPLVLYRSAVPGVIAPIECVWDL